MKIIQLHSRLIILAVSLIISALLTESVSAQGEALQLPGDPGEGIELVCNSSLYGVDEIIHYTASYDGPGKSDVRPWSKILYVELIQRDGSKQVGSKILIENGRAEGEIRVPRNIPSGVYYLRAYTLWLRNYGPRFYTYIPLRILNPYSKEILAPQLDIDTLRMTEQSSVKTMEDVEFPDLKEAYEARENAEFEIRIPGNLLSGTYSLSIAKSESLSSLDYGLNEDIITEENSGEVIYMPEIEGLSLSGRIVDAESGLPVENSRLQLSSYTDPFLFSELSSGKDGSFLFTLPHFSASPEFHLAEAADSEHSHLIRLDPEFCTKAISLPYLPLSVDSSEQELVRELLLNLQLKERFRFNVEMEKSDPGVSTSFYGSQTSLTKVGEYIELSDLRECVEEIIPQVFIRGSNEGEHLTIAGPGCLDIYPPLVLIDNVPVPNNADLLRIPSSRINSVEVLNEAYMIGDSRYSGILNIFSNQNDMAGITLEGEHSFFDLKLLDSKSSQVDADVSANPDIRNQLFWEPELEFNENGIVKVSFSTSDAIGQYVLTLRGSKQGNNSGSYKQALIMVK